MGGISTRRYRTLRQQAPTASHVLLYSDLSMHRMQGMSDRPRLAHLRRAGSNLFSRDRPTPRISSGTVQRSPHRDVEVPFGSCGPQFQKPLSPRGLVPLRRLLIVFARSAKGQTPIPFGLPPLLGIGWTFAGEASPRLHRRCGCQGGVWDLMRVIQWRDEIGEAGRVGPHGRRGGGVRGDPGAGGLADEAAVIGNR